MHRALDIRQSRIMSLAEASANVVVGFVLAVATQAILFPPLGLEVTLEIHLLIGGVFTVVSIARSYALRRLFEGIRTRDHLRSSCKC